MFYFQMVFERCLSAIVTAACLKGTLNYYNFVLYDFFIFMKLFFSSSFSNGRHHSFLVFELSLQVPPLSSVVESDIGNREGLDFVALLKHQFRLLNRWKCTFKSWALKIMGRGTLEIRIALLNGLGSVVYK